MFLKYNNHLNHNQNMHQRGISMTQSPIIEFVLEKIMESQNKHKILWL
jgi:hypothetical protein